MAFITTALSVVVVAAFVSTVSCGTCTPVHIPLPMGSVTADNMDPEYQHGDIFYQNCTDAPISTMRKTVGWCQDFHATSSRIQITLPHTMAVNAIVFQTHQAYCPKTLDYSSTAYMGTFDLQYVVPGDSQGLLVTYDQDLPALDGTASEKTLEFTQPLVTQTLQIIPKFANQYPCFRFMLLGCEAESMCKKDLCLNGGKCSGNNFCTCAVGFFGERCNQTVEELVQEDYSFTEIKNGLLDSPGASFKVFGDVTLVPSSDRRRDHHHGSHGHSCHFGGHHGHHGHCEHHEHHHHDNHHHHDHHHGHDCNCHAMHNLHEHHHGFTTSLNVHFGHDHHHDSHCHLFSNGGNVAGPHSGASLHYHQGHLHFEVKTDQHHWHVTHQCNLLTATVHNIACSWHPHTGVSLILNNQPVASSNQAKPLPTAAPTAAPTTTTTTTTAAPTTKTPTTTAPVTSAPAGPAPAAVTVTSLPLRICNGHTTVSVNVQLTINVTIGALNMYPVPQNTLCNLNKNGPYLPPPPTIAPPPTTSTQSTTTVPVTATSTHAPTTSTTSTAAPTTTTDPHRPVCYNYANQASIVASTAKTRCKYGEVCALFKDQNGFTAKCLTEALCKSGQNLAGSNCFECCKTYLCNDNCSAPKANTCADQSSCAVLMSTGFDVCSDQQKAVDICPKTCNICSSMP